MHIYPRTTVTDGKLIITAHADNDEEPPIILSKEEYFSQPNCYHPHPQGMPCHVSCRDWHTGELVFSNETN